MMKMRAHRDERPDAPKKVAFYIRVSTEEQAENPEGSIKNQEERLHATLRLKNMDGNFGELVTVYVDRARSGKDTNRPELQRMLQAIERGEITLVMVSELSRLTRSVKDFAWIRDLMDEHHCGMLSLRESFDSTTAAGEMVMFLMANLAQFERRQISERIGANFQVRAARGLYNGGQVPVGFRIVPDRPGYLEPDPERAGTVRTAFETFLKEGSLSAAARSLNQQGHSFRRHTEGGGSKPKTGLFTFQNLYDVLRNPAYVGIRRYRVKGEWRETKAVWDGIVDPSIFEDAQKLLSENHCRKKPESVVRYPFVLTGILYCETCRERLVGKSANGNGGKIPYYDHGSVLKRKQCTVGRTEIACNPKRVLAKRLEEAVWGELMRVITEPKMSEAILGEARMLSEKQKSASPVPALRCKVQGVTRRLDGLTERLSELPKAVSATPIFTQMQKLQADQARLEAELREAEQSERAGNGSSSGEVPADLESFQALHRTLNRLAREEDREGSEAIRSEIIRALVHRIEVTQAGFQIHFYVGAENTKRGACVGSHRDPTAQRLAKSASSRSSSSRTSLIGGSNTLTNGGP